MGSSTTKSSYCNPASGNNVTCVASGVEGAVSTNISGFASGGGFSNISSMPEYQKAAVAAYLKTDQLPPASMYNAKGRGYPDVSALGNNFAVFMGGQGQPGTFQ